MCIRLSHIMGLLALFVAMIGHSPAQSSSKEPPREMMTVLQTDFEGFNANNFALSDSQYGSQVVIIDDFPPYRWEAARAHAEWWADFRRIAKDIDATSYHSSFQKPTHWEESSGRAFICFPEKFTWTAGEKAYTENLICTDVLIESGTAWKIGGVGCSQA